MQFIQYLGDVGTICLNLRFEPGEIKPVDDEEVASVLLLNPDFKLVKTGPAATQPELPLVGSDEF